SRKPSRLNGTLLRPPQMAEKRALVETQHGVEVAVRQGAGRRRCTLEFCFQQLETLLGEAEPPLGTSGEGTRANQAPAGRQLEPGIIEALGKRESFLAIAKRLLWQAVTRQRPHVGGAQEREGSKITRPSGEVLPVGIKNPRFFLGKPGFCATK